MSGLGIEELEEVILAVSLVSPLSNAVVIVVRRPGGAAVEALFFAGSRGISFPGYSCRS